MRVGISLRLKLALIMGLTATLACTAITAALYLRQQAALLSGVDTRLFAAANFAKAALPTDYHDRITDASSVPPEEFARIVDRHNQLCMRLELQYLWSNMMIDDRIVFTTATSPSKHLFKGDHARFFDVHRDPGAFTTAFSNMQVDYSSFHNEWGHGRMVLVPFRDRQGRKFCFGASVSTADVQQVLRETLWHSILVSSVVLLSALLISAALAGSIANPIRSLTTVAESIAAGDPHQEAHFGGCREVTMLSGAVNKMSKAIRRTMDEIERSREDLRSTLNSIGDAVIATGPDGTIKGMNPVAEQLSECPADQAAGRPVGDVLDIRDMNGVRDTESPVARIMEAGRVVVWPTDATLVGRNGTERRVARSGAPISAGSGDIVGVVLILRDVTEERLLAEQLRQAQKMDSLGQLAGGIAHDFNNMLGGIMSAADFLKVKITDETQQKMVNVILDGAGRASGLTRQLLAFSRKANVHAVPIDLHDLLNETIRLLERTIDRRVTIESEFVHAGICVQGDPAQLENAFLNLGINARDAMPGGGKIQVITETKHVNTEACRSHGLEESAAGSFALVRIADSGHGMDAATLERAFEPFFTTKEVGGGTGLGLSAVYGTVREHGGFVTGTSVKGEGSEFCVYLPLSDEIPQKPVISREEEPAAPGRTVLLVDDEEVIRKSTSAVLRDQAYTVILARDGLEAVALYRELGSSIDVVLLDLVMPRMNGKDVFFALREMDPDVRVLLSSGFARDGIASEILGEPEIMGFVQKPYRRPELLAALARALGETGTDPA